MDINLRITLYILYVYTSQFLFRIVFSQARVKMNEKRKF